MPERVWDRANEAAEMGQGNCRQRAGRTAVTRGSAPEIERDVAIHHGSDGEIGFDPPLGCLTQPRPFLGMVQKEERLTRKFRGISKLNEPTCFVMPDEIPISGNIGRDDR